jgi:hypothetical protein
VNPATTIPQLPFEILWALKFVIFPVSYKVDPDSSCWFSKRVIPVNPATIPQLPSFEIIGPLKLSFPVKKLLYITGSRVILFVSVNPVHQILGLWINESSIQSINVCFALLCFAGYVVTETISDIISCFPPTMYLVSMMMMMITLFF